MLASSSCMLEMLWRTEKSALIYRHTFVFIFILAKKDDVLYLDNIYLKNIIILIPLIFCNGLVI